MKRTVNYDDPRTYHLYFGDASGNPGSLLTFFPWPGAGRGHDGGPGTREVALRVPRGSLGYWADRLTEAGLSFGQEERFGAPVLAFSDPDGSALALVEGEAPPLPGPDPSTEPSNGEAKGPRQPQAMDILRPVRYFPAALVPPEAAIVCIDHVTLAVPDVGQAEEQLTRALGMEAVARAAGRIRLAPAGAGPDAARALDLVRSEGTAGRAGRGSYHHVAFEVASEEELAAGRRAALSEGFPATQAKDRTYFRSVYFPGPGGAILELATSGPGFTVDEPVEELGLAFKLPSWLETERQDIRAQLPVTVSPEYAHLYR